MSIHIISTTLSTPEWELRCVTVLCWLSDIWVLWCQWVIPVSMGPSPPPPSSFCSSLSPPQGSIDCFNRVRDVCSNIADGWEWKPRLKCPYSQSSVCRLTSCTFCRPAFNLMHFTLDSIPLVIWWWLVIINYSQSVETLSNSNSHMSVNLNRL